MAKSTLKDDQVARQITGWLAQEKITPERRPPSGGLSFQLDFAYPAGPTPAAKIICARQKGRDATGIVIVVRLDPNHKNAFASVPQAKREEFYAHLRRVALQGGTVGFGPQVENGALVGWQLDVTIYDDGLTQHAYMTGLRQVLSKHLEIIDELNTRLGMRSPTLSAQQDTMFI